MDETLGCLWQGVSTRNGGAVRVVSGHRELTMVSLFLPRLHVSFASWRIGYQFGISHVSIRLWHIISLETV